MARGSQPAEGTRIEYGQTMGRMGDVGSEPSVHAHVEAPAAVFERYINDITSGRIQSNGAAVSSPAINADPMADGVLKRGEAGDAVKALQDALNKAGIRDAQGQPLPLTGNFGEKTEAAVRQYQQGKSLEVDGKAGNDTLTALGLKPGQQQTPAPAVTPTPQPAIPSAKPSENTAATPPTATTGGSDFGAQLRSSDLKNTSIYLAIGLAEGTIGRNGAPTSAYFEHIDPGNGKVNKGFGSYQVSQDPRGNSLTPEQADGIQANRLAGQWQRVDSALNEAGFKPGPARDLIAANALDAWNQSPLTFEDRYGLMNKQQLTQLKQSIDGGTSPQAAVTEWRAQSYRDNNGNLDAPGLGGSMERVREDQGRRVAAIAEGLQLRPVQAHSGDQTAPSQPSTPSGAAPVTTTIYREGDNSDGVRKLQEALNKNGATLEIDGKFGPGTKAAVESYQRAHSLDVDGIAGPKTLAALGITQAQSAPAAAATPPAPTANTQPAQPAAPNASTPPAANDHGHSHAPTPPAPPANAHPAQPAAPNASTPPAANDHGHSHAPTQPTPPANAPAVQSDKSLMSSPDFSDKGLNKLYNQAVSNLEQLGPSGGFKSREELEKAAAAVAGDAKKTGLTDIDHISKTTTPNGQTLLVAVQGDPTKDGSNRSYIDFGQATSHSISISLKHQ